MASSISSGDISQFLNDIEANINHDNSTDFRKLILFLFTFTSTQLERLRDASHSTDPLLSRPDRVQLLMRLFSALELVLSKRLFLLNELLSHQDIAAIAKHTASPQNASTKLYDWAIDFALLHIAPFHREMRILNRIKSFIISLINLVSTRLRSLRTIADARASAIDFLESNVAWLLASLDQLHLDAFCARLCTVTHFLSIVNDYDIATKLLLSSHPPSLLRIESVVRKVWFVLNKSRDADSLKSIILLASTSSILLNDAVQYNKISMLSEWLVDLISTMGEPCLADDTMPLAHATCLCLLRLLLFSLHRDIVYTFVTGCGLNRYLDSLKMPATSPLPPLLHTLHLIRYYSNLDNADVCTEYHASYQQLESPFQNPGLEQVRIDLALWLLKSNAHQKVSRLLHYDGSDSIDSPVDKSQPSIPFNHKKWILAVRKQILLPAWLLDNPLRLHTLLEALGNFASILGDKHSCQNSHGSNKPYSSISFLRPALQSSSEMALCYDHVLTRLYQVEVNNALKTSPLTLCAFFNALFKVFAAFRPPCENLSTDPIFSLLAHTLTHNDNRDARMTAAKVLPLYLISPKTMQADLNFKTIFAMLVSIDFTNRGRCHFAESTIVALASMAIVSRGEWLCAIMIKLLYLLGEANDQHVNYVYTSCLSIAHAKSLSPYKLLSLFIPSTAEVIIKKPLMLTRVTQLIGVSKKLFLSRTREYTVPRLLEYYKHDYIKEIADSINISKASLVAKSLPRILAFYLVQNTRVDEKYIQCVLANVNPNYKNAKLRELVSAVGATTWFILLHIQYDEALEKIVNEDNINCALEYVARTSLIERDHTRNNLPLTSQQIVVAHLGEHVLELVQRFSENVHQIRGTTPFLEKLSSLRAIEYLINQNISVISSALGQISSCLQASLENPDFQVLALKCWNGLVKNLPPNNLISLIDIIISLIFQKFETFESKSKQLANEILQKIYSGILDKYKRFSLYYLSLPFISHIQDFLPIKDFKNVKQLSSSSIILEFTRRLKTSNKYVVQQALCDLQNYCEGYQLNCQSDWFRDVSLESQINALVREILDTASKFKLRNEKISTQCATVLARIGSLDPNKFHFKAIKDQIIILHDFRDFRENADFLVHLIETMVLKTFWASNDPLKQLFSAYAMQNFLLIMRLDKKVLKPASQQDYLVEVWNKFSDVAKSTLTPLLSSKYLALESRSEKLEFPYYKVGLQHQVWLVDVTSNMLKRPLKTVLENQHGSKKFEIFTTCAKLIRDEDVALCQHLLKYCALSHIINGDIDATDDIKVEFLNILQTNLLEAQPDKVDSIKSCYQTVLEVLDYFHAWISTATQYLNNYELEASESKRVKTHIGLAEGFLGFIPMDLIASKLADCDSYERTILYLEKCFRDGKVKEDHHLENMNVVTTLQSMYSSIDDYDALNGVLKIFSTNNLAEKLSTFQYNESWSLAQESFKIMSGMGPDQVDCNTKLLKSLSLHGLYEDVLLTLGAKTDERELVAIPLDWALSGLLAAAYQGSREEIDKWLTITKSIGHPQDLDSTISYEIAVGIKHLLQGKNSGFQNASENLYGKIGAALVPSVSSSFSRNVNLMNQLHALYDMSLIVSSGRAPELQEGCERILDARLANVGQNFDLVFRILTLHQVANKSVGDQEKMSKLYLRCSALARENQRLDIARSSIIRAMVLNDGEANIEYARLLWAEKKQTEAIKSLSDIIKDNKFSSHKIKASVQLTFADWLDSLNHSSAQTIINEYNKAITLYPEWEKPYYALGVYYNKIMASARDTLGYYERQTLRNFFKALAVGTLFVFEALPKSITIWLDLAQRKNRTREAERSLNQIIEDLNTCISTMPVYVWYTATTQILSRIVHEHEKLYEKLASIVTLIILAYPRHLLWYVLSHANSNDQSRKERVHKILRSAKNNNSQMAALTDEALELFKTLIAIASYKISRSLRTKRLSLARDFKITTLSKAYTALVIPVASNLSIRIPTVATAKFNAFPRLASITFDGFDDVVNVFVSLQMPRQVTIRGLDQQPYRLMVKRDDTRKDAKVVEFTTMINRLLLSSVEARRRNLHIANYAVVPLTENMGVIEFVTDVQTMKLIVVEQRRHTGKSFNEHKVFAKIEDAQRVFKSGKASDAALLALLIQTYERVCREYQPVLQNWYIDQFSDPAAWYLARTRFTRLAAVMSIVGYIIGLGDRHCENILFYKKNGAVLHIDFDCLFDKGATLPTPEIVPFRLTQNMVDAMGICGYEGSFRAACEVTGTILRAHEAPLMNILETLLYDPLLDWKSLQKPEVHLSKVRRKIRGILDEKEGLPMNVNGQVDVLIQEATSVERLAQMYAGWSAYI